MGRPRDKIRLAAMERGDSTYMGNPCYKGHSGKRYTCGGHCYECQQIKGPALAAEYRKTPAWKAYQKEYRAKYGKDPKNKERLREIQVRWYVKKYYNGDMEHYLHVQEDKAERRAEKAAHEAEVDFRRQLRKNR